MNTASILQLTRVYPRRGGICPGFDGFMIGTVKPII